MTGVGVMLYKNSVIAKGVFAKANMYCGYLTKRVCNNYDGVASLSSNDFR